jgi:DNA-binding transcriptional LysR family regulator
MQPYDIVTIRLFVAVAKAGSIAGAARQQHIAASAVSHRIHELELATGTNLLNRLPRGVELTAAGRVFMERGIRILDELRDLDNDLKQFAEGGRGIVRVAAATTAITSRLSDILKDFIDGNPDITVDLIELYSNEAADALRQGECEIALVTDMCDLAGLQTCHFSSDAVWVIGPSEHPLFKKRDAQGAISFADAMQYEVISLHQGGALDELVLAAAKKLGSPLKRALRVSRNDSLRRLVEAGLGIGFLRESNAKPYLSAFALEGAPLSDKWAKRELKVAWLKGATLDPATKRFRDFLSQKTA